MLYQNAQGIYMLEHDEACPTVCVCVAPCGYASMGYAGFRQVQPPGRALTLLGSRKKTGASVSTSSTTKKCLQSRRAKRPTRLLYALLATF
jgi:hypothetical protein